MRGIGYPRLSTSETHFDAQTASDAAYYLHRRRPEGNKAVVYEPSISGFVNDKVVAAFPDSGSPRNIVSHDFVRRERLQIIKSTSGKIQTANGSPVRSLGTVNLHFRFSGEDQTYLREFHVLSRSLYDVILGNQFLRETKTFTHFAHRIVKKLRGVASKSRVCFTGSPQQMLTGWADGESTLALPDTGSDICLMSPAYAKERGYRINTDHVHRRRVEFVDGSTTDTLGKVEAFQWEFGLSDSRVHYPDVYVLENLQTDLLLSYDFLMSSEAFSTHEEAFFDTDPSGWDLVEAWMVSTIKLVTESKFWKFGKKMARNMGANVASRSSAGKCMHANESDIVC